MDLNQAVIARRRRVPLPESVPGDGSAAAASSTPRSCRRASSCRATCSRTCPRGRPGRSSTSASRCSARSGQIAGDHVRHNPYFRDFPFNVPATLEFWAELIERALAVGIVPGSGAYVDIGDGELVEAGSLLSLPGYGTVQHTYEDMLAAHEALAVSAGDRITVLHKGGTPDDESAGALPGARRVAGTAGRRGPGAARGAGRRVHRRAAAGAHPGAGEPGGHQRGRARERPPAARRHGDRRAPARRGGLGRGRDAGDATRFRSFTRPERRVLMAALDSVVAATARPSSPTSAGHAEPWKRLGERLHPHEYERFPHAQRVFAVARGEERFPSLTVAGRAGTSRGGRPRRPRGAWRPRPACCSGRLTGCCAERHGGRAGASSPVPPRRRRQSVSGRVLLSVREHFQNRGTGDEAGLPRIFANRNGRAWVTPETRAGNRPGRRGVTCSPCWTPRSRRGCREGGRVIVDPAVLGVALPLSGKPAAPGLGVMPRGSVTAMSSRATRTCCVSSSTGGRRRGAPTTTCPR